MHLWQIGNAIGLYPIQGVRFLTGALARKGTKWDSEESGLSDILNDGLHLTACVPDFQTCERETMIRTFYDSIQGGTRLVHSDGSDILIRDGERSLPVLMSYYDKLVLYSDFVRPELESLFDGPEVKPDGDPSERVVDSDLPWEWVGNIPRTNAVMETFAEHPDWIFCQWYEASNAEAYECFGILEQIVRRRQNRECLMCIDGPCEGDKANIESGEWRVEVSNHDTPLTYSVYERVENKFLKYVRASNR